VKRLRTTIENVPAVQQTPTKENQEVTKLMQASAIQQVAANVDVLQKKFIYKLATQSKDGNSRTTLDLLWKAFMAAPDSETIKRGKAILESKHQLVQVVEALEKDSLVMYSPEDGSVVLI
jgi:hypothetical protein